MSIDISNESGIECDERSLVVRLNEVDGDARCLRALRHHAIDVR